MSVFAHLVSLRRKHEVLKEQLHEAMKYHACEEEIKQLKKMKLRIKDEIMQMEQDIQNRRPVASYEEKKKKAA